ncbi:MAG: hypothetical protein E7408_05505 [Ruminococcaceae bacterium]|nr:hypothetical protein [Oscillospiraceae bacterium]
MREEILKNPKTKYRSVPFWAWNGELKKERLLEEIEAFQVMGFGGFYMHARCGLQTPYLGDAFMEAVRFCTEEAAKRGMYAHLYDEDRYPSGHCGGKITKNPAFMGRQLSLRFAPKTDALKEEDAIREKRPYLVGRYDITFAQDNTMRAYSMLSEGETAKNTEVWIYSTLLPQSGWYNGSNHPDVLNPEATKAFIRETHEKYKATVGGAFGNVIPSVFTDEPNIGHVGWFDIGFTDSLSMFWTRSIPNLYREKYGEDLVAVLPEVFYNWADKENYGVRYRFLDLTAELFKVAYSEQLATWCEENHLLCTGHFNTEATLAGQTSNSVDTMRQYAPYHVPGVDFLFEKVELTTAKQALSAVHQYGREMCMTELYGGARWGCDFRRYKMQTDWQTALGLTLRVPHLAFYSMEGEAKHDYPASIGPQSPWYKEFSVLENHFARTATAMSEGDPVIKIGVIHPIETFWLGLGLDKKAEKRSARIEDIFQNTAEWLMRSHLDFDYISEALLPTLWDGEKIGKMQYEAIIVPGCQTLRRTTAEMLEVFSGNGGKVVFIGACPAFSDGIPSDIIRPLFEKSICVPPEKFALIDALEDHRTVEIRKNKNNFNFEGVAAEDYVYGLRKDAEGGWLMIACAAPKENYDITAPEKLYIKIKGEHKACLYNTVDAKREALAYKTEDGYTYIEKDVQPLESLLIRLGEDVEPEETTVYEKRISLGEKAAYRLSEENVLVLDMAEYALDDAVFAEKEDIFKIGDIICASLGWEPNRGKYTQPYIKQHEDAHALRLRYRFESEVETVAALGIEFPEKTDVSLNGVPLGKETAGYYIDHAIRRLPDLKIRKGENVLEIKMPFTHHIQPQVLYLLGEYGVRVRGSHACITAKEDILYIGDAATQGLPFYGGNIQYIFETETEACTARLSCNYFRAAALKVSMDEKDVGFIFSPPYESPAFALSEGRHTITVTALGTRENTLAPLHAVQEKGWYAYWQYRPAENAHTEGYNLPKLGILKAPSLLVYKEKADKSTG